MSSPAQALANACNASLSTGPKTEAGKAHDRCPVGADSVLNERAALALDPAENAGEIEHHSKHQRGFDENNREIDDHDWPPPPLLNSTPCPPIAS